MSAIAYLRALPGRPIEQQRRSLSEFCERHGLDLQRSFSDAGDGVPELRELLGQLRGPRGAEDGSATAAVVIDSTEVLGASVRERARRYLQLSALGGDVLLPDSGLDRDAFDTALVEAWQARGSAERRRERVRESMRRRALRGQPLGRPPFGYRVVQRRLEVVPREAELVREIFRQFLDQGEGVRRIAGRLNDAGFRTRSGRPWSMAAVRDVLRNQAYIGTYRRLGVVVPRSHEAMVTRDRFDLAQEQLASRRSEGSAPRRHEYLLSGLLTCGHCGNRLIGARRSRRPSPGSDAREYRYYQCESRSNQGRCDYHTRRAEELEVALLTRITEGPAPQDAVVPGESGADPAGEDEAGGRRAGRQRELDRMLERRATGRWDAAQLRARAAALVLEDLAEEQRREHQSGARSGGDQVTLARERLIAEWGALSIPERRALLREIIDGAVVTDQAVQVRFRAPVRGVG
jgi:DNA invertase Pin-like site-specific DNA recombinase